MLAALAVVLSRRLGGRHQRAMGEVLDAADALEARLRAARAEIEAVAELRSVRDSIEAARQRIDHQLARIERARAPQA